MCTTLMRGGVISDEKTPTNLWQISYRQSESPFRGVASIGRDRAVVSRIQGLLYEQGNALEVLCL